MRVVSGTRLAWLSFLRLPARASGGADAPPAWPVAALSGKTNSFSLAGSTATAGFNPAVNGLRSAMTPPDCLTRRLSGRLARRAGAGIRQQLAEQRLHLGRRLAGARAELPDD